MSAYDVPDTVFGTEDIAMNRADTHLIPFPK